MITEKDFANGFSGFWSGLLPMLELRIRELNLISERFLPPLKSELPATTHGLVNEMGFRIFETAIRQGVSLAELTQEAIAAAAAAATSHIRHMRQLSRAPIPDATSLDIAEAKQLAERYARFFRNKHPFLQPAFPGCGWLSECSGDALVDSTLFEFKAGQRKFRSIDVRQALIYCALNFAAKRYDITTLCLVNPRLGTFVEEDLELLCQEISGASAVETLSAIVEYCSEAHDRYQAG